MTIEQAGVVDFISIDSTTGEVILTISDHLQWDAENEHLLLLQEKLNSYLAFVESDEIIKTFPDAEERPVAIHLACKYSPSLQGIGFLEKVTAFIHDAGFKFSYSVLPD